MRPENVRVAGFGAVGFPELYDMLQRTSVEQKQRWADDLARMRAGPEKRLAAIAFYAAWVQFDAPAACASLLSFPDLLMRELIVGSVSSAAPAEAMPQLAGLVLQFSALERQHLLPGVLREWAVTDPAAAAEFVTQHSDSIETDGVVNLIGDWTELDPDAVRAWLERSEKFFANEMVVSAFIAKWLERNSAAATEYVRTHAGADGFSGALRSIVSLAYQQGVGRALQFIASLPANGKSFAFDQLLSMASEDPAALAEFADWTARLPKGESEIDSAAVLATWALRDEEGALQWIARRPSAERSHLTLMFLTEGARLTPRTAALALSLQSQNEREQAVRSLVAPYSEDDDMRRAIAELHLSRKQTSALFRILELEQ